MITVTTSHVIPELGGPSSILSDRLAVVARDWSDRPTDDSKGSGLKYDFDYAPTGEHVTVTITQPDSYIKG